MPPTPATPRAARLLAPAVLAALVGCQTHHTTPAREAPRLDAARALAHYAVGRMVSAVAAARDMPPPPAALGAFLEAHRLDPASSGPVEAAAQLLAREDRAHDLLALLASHAPRAAAPAFAFHQLGLCAEFLGNPALAIRAHTHALQSPGLPENLRLPVVTALARACMAAGRDASAMRAIRRGAANPGLRGAMFALAEAWAREFSGTGQNERAAGMARFAATLAPGRAAFASAKRLEARALGRAGKKRGAEKILLQLLASPGDAAAAIDLGLLFARAGETNAVLRLQGKKSAAQNPLRVLAAAAAWHEWGDDAAAQNLMLGAYPPDNPAAFPNSLHFFLAYGNILIDAGNFEAAARVARHAAGRKNPPPEILNLHAHVLALRNESLGEAEAAAHRALGRDPFNPAYLGTLGLALLRQGRFSEALDTLRQALVFAPGDPVIQARFDEAMRAFEGRTDAGERE